MRICVVQMNKIASYLRGHLSGEVSVRDDVIAAMALDSGVLEQKPEMVIYPRNTNDIRKVARFSWQLAEKGHKLPVTVRGAGTDATGAAIGSGISLVTAVHLDKLCEYDAKQKLVRLQPGATIAALDAALGLHGTGIMALRGSNPFGTVGGAIANATTGIMAGKYRTIAASIDQLEVVLANGDVLQTKRLTKRELNKVKGEQTFTGDVYRGIDRIIEDYADTLAQLGANDATGYNTVADVKRKDGSFDLTPLFVGSQGTLGIISEMIMRTEFRSMHVGTAALVFESGEQARDALDDVRKMTPAFIEYFDAELFDRAATAGKKYDFYTTSKETIVPAVVVLVGFDDFSERHRAKNIKRLTKLFNKQAGVVCVTAEGDINDAIADTMGVSYYSALPDHAADGSPELFTGFYVPTERLEEFTKDLAEIAKKEHTSLPMAGHASTNIYGVYPVFSLSKVSDKQKIFKLLDELTALVYAYGGTMLAEGGEGRLKAKYIYSQLDEKLVSMYAEIRQVCDPFGTLNPGVKQVSDVRAIAGMLRDHHEAGQRARYGL